MDFYLSQLEETYDDISLEENRERKETNYVILTCLEESMCITKKDLNDFHKKSERTKDLFNIVSINGEVEVCQKKLKQMKTTKDICEKIIQGCLEYENHIERQKIRIQEKIRAVKQYKDDINQLRKSTVDCSYSHRYRISHMIPGFVESLLKSSCL